MESGDNTAEAKSQSIKYDPKSGISQAEWDDQIGQIRRLGVFPNKAGWVSANYDSQDLEFPLDPEILGAIPTWLPGKVPRTEAVYDKELTLLAKSPTPQ